jgi:hypothetical protein
MKITDVVGPYAITAKSGCAVIASASEAIHGATEKWISSSRSLLAMTLRIVQAHTFLFFAINTHTSAISPRDARVLPLVKPSETQRAWGMPGARCTRSLAWKKIEPHERSHCGFTGFTRHSRTQWF